VLTTYAHLLAQFNIPRHRITILTKCFMLVHDDLGVHTGTVSGLTDTRDYVNQAGLSRQAIYNQVNASLARLDTDYIDLLQIHRADLNNVTAEVRCGLRKRRRRPADSRTQETMKALHDLVESGKVRYIGASSMWTWQFAHYNHVAEKVCVSDSSIGMSC
jgi:aryl-alcohol dehydrogenase-like predicted oxidoreductase